MLTHDMTEVSLGAKSIGSFSTEKLAWKAVERLIEKPGFRDWPGGFRVVAVPLDVDFFPGGFNPDAG